MISARARFIGTYAISARFGVRGKQLRKGRAGIAPVVNLRAVPLRAFTDLRLHNVAYRLIGSVLGEQPLHREALCRSRRPKRISSIVVEDANPGMH